MKYSIDITLQLNHIQITYRLRILTMSVMASKVLKVAPVETIKVARAVLMGGNQANYGH